MLYHLFSIAIIIINMSLLLICHYYYCIIFLYIYYIKRIKKFVSSNNNILNISFIYSSLSKNNSIRPDGGYSCVSTVPLTGIHSYPAIFSFPNEPPLNHWPNIISIIQTKQKHRQYSQNDSTSSKYNRKTLEYCNSIDSINSTFSSYSIGSTATTITNNNNNMNITSSSNNNNSSSNNSNNNNNSNTAPNITSTNSSNQKIISDTASISSLSNAASYLMGTRRTDKRKRNSRSLSFSNPKDSSGADKDTSQSLDETSTVPFFFYDWKISISYYLIKVDPEVIIVLIYECQNKDPAIIDFLTRLVACLRNVTLFEQLKVDW